MELGNRKWKGRELPHHQGNDGCSYLELHVSFRNTSLTNAVLTRIWYQLGCEPGGLHSSTKEGQRPIWAKHRVEYFRSSAWAKHWGLCYRNHFPQHGVLTAYGMKIHHHIGNSTLTLATHPDLPDACPPFASFSQAEYLMSSIFTIRRWKPLEAPCQWASHSIANSVSPFIKSSLLKAAPAAEVPMTVANRSAMIGQTVAALPSRATRTGMLQHISQPAKIDAGSQAGVATDNADKWKQGHGSGQRRETEVCGDELSERVLSCVCPHLFLFWVNNEKGCLD